MDYGEYNDVYFCAHILDEWCIPIHINEEAQSATPVRTDTLRLTQQFNESFLKYSRKLIEITPLSVIIDDIKNYRPLSELQLEQLEIFTDEEKIKVIKVYNQMYLSLENII